MAGFILRGLFVALGLWAATSIMDGIMIDKPLTLILAGLLLGVVNAIVRPVLVVLTFPLTVVTFGLFLLVVNAATIGLTAVVLKGFVVDGLGAGIGAAIVTGVVSWIAGSLIKDEPREG